MFNRSTLPQGFSDLNRLLSDIQDGLVKAPDSIKTINEVKRYPFTDICTSEDGVLHIEMAVAGFGPDDLEISIEDGLLVVKGTVSKEILNDDEGMKYTQRQIAKRNFISKFRLDTRYAESRGIYPTTKNGILTISIWPVKEEKPKVQKFSVEGL